MLGKKTLVATLLVTAGLSGAARAQGDTFAGAILGGALGAVVGHSIGGHDAAVVGGVIGAAAGASIAESERDYRPAPYYGRGSYYGAPGAQVVVAEAPRYYASPAVYSPPVARVVYTRDDYYGRRQDRRNDYGRDSRSHWHDDGRRTDGWHGHD